MASVRACVCACVVEIKLGMLRVLVALLVYAFGRAYGLSYKMATFIAKKGVIQYGLLCTCRWITS